MQSWLKGPDDGLAGDREAPLAFNELFDPLIRLALAHASVILSAARKILQVLDFRTQRRWLLEIGLITKIFASRGVTISSNLDLVVQMLEPPVVLSARIG